MKELVIISGKGGTGKTSITASLAALAEKAVVVDCDVDAADMHLVLEPEIQEKHYFFGGKEASIKENLCAQCGKCLEVCKFDAVKYDQNNKFKIDEIACEGCGVCFKFCPADAITFEEKLSGEWYISKTRFGTLIHAKLGVAEENSGKLVSRIRNQARLSAKREGAELIIADGSPGIGCPVIASISGADAVLIVIEPTLSGIHDFKRVLELTRHFKIPACVCVNKFDLNEELTEEVEIFCEQNSIEIVGKIPYNKVFTEAMIKKLTIVEYSDDFVSKEIKNMWKKLKNRLK